MLRKKFIILLSFLIIAVIGTGYGIFIFENPNSDGSITGNHQLDDIRENYVFGDGTDKVDLPSIRYNVYFMAQSDFDPREKINGEYKMHYGSTLNMDYGYFGNKEDNVYYKVFKNVSEISAYDLFYTVGEPNTNCVDDIPWPLHFNGWSLDWNVGNYNYFCDLNDDGISDYNADNPNYITMDGKKKIKVTGSFPHGDTAVRTMRFGITIQSYIDLIPEKLRSKYVIDNGTEVKDFFLYPIYTTGKDYDGGWRKKNNPIQILYGKNKNEKEKEAFLNNGVTLNSNFMEHTNLPNITAYNKYAFDLNGETILKFRYTNVAGGEYWNSWYPIGMKKDTTLCDDYKTMEGNAVNLIERLDKKLTGSTGLGTGIFSNGDGIGEGLYAIYCFKKEMPFDDFVEYTGEEIKAIHDFCDKTVKVQRYYSFISNVLPLEFGYEGPTKAQMYFVFERYYSPKLLGGQSGSFDYESPECSEYSFTRSLKDKTVFGLPNIKMSANEDTDWHTYRDHEISSAIFNLKLDGVTHYSSKKVFGTEENRKTDFANVTLGDKEKYNAAKYFVKVDENTDLTNYVRSKNYPIKTLKDIQDPDLKKEIADSFIIRGKIDDPGDTPEDPKQKFLGYGIYSFAIKLDYMDREEVDVNNLASEFGPYAPDETRVYVQRETNIFTLIYDGTADDDKFVNKPEDSNHPFGGFVRPELLNNDEIKYAFIAENAFLDTYLEGTDVFKASQCVTKLNLINPTTGNTITPGDSLTLSEIIKIFNEQLNKELYDRITGFVLSEESLTKTKFKIEKNYIFQSRDKSN